MEKKQSSIDWLASNLGEHIVWEEKIIDLIEQAKAMHKEEQISFAKRCLDKALDLDVRTAHSQVEEVYNETFGGNNE